MKVKRRDLVEGCILSSDVYSKSTTPLITKQTVLTSEHLDVLKAFLIEDVSVEPKLVSGQKFRVSLSRNHITDEVLSEIPTIHHYLQGVKQHEKLFNDWQQGKNIDIFSVVALINPLIDGFLEDPIHLFEVNNYVVSEAYIHHHAIGVGLLSAYIGDKLNYPKKEVYDIGLAGFIADCGMAKLPPRLYRKREVLNETEIRQIERHPIYGYQMLKDLPTVKEGVVQAVLQHHEREDGSGYPLKIVGKRLHPYAKIVSISDAYFAMISERPYRRKRTPFKVLELIRQEGFGKYDHHVYSVLADEVIRFTIGRKVRLTNQTTGEIAFIPKGYPIYPILRMESGVTLSLKDHPELDIEELL
ncbi:HD-GYP domain-containing protein [Camelliibacillus cellulosilyticus]|uniref:HD-GYP domain-containing protein n=1 Tax=Camelliibacillus cellulosilyticus TaxID=2174486 RepID=A0ABV9GQ55_9BACL